MSDSNGRLEVAFEPLTVLAVGGLIVGLSIAAGILAGVTAWERAQRR
ncbi:hypothetical protein [uncultured Nocardioides sp.]|nr:hypothetical protein [uncultured Nocardioides sp.]